jgi:hypothetical protein
MIVQSSNIAEDIFLLSRGDAEIQCTPEENTAYNMISRRKEKTRYGDINYISGLTESTISSEKKDIIVTYRSIKTNNNFYIIEKNNEGKYSNGIGDNILAVYREKSSYRLEWESIQNYVPNMQVKVRPEFTEYYEGMPNSPWEGKDANYIMRWLNYWSTSNFMIVKSKNITEDLFLLNNGDAKIERSSEKEDAYNIITREKEVVRYGHKDYVSGNDTI